MATYRRRAWLILDGVLQLHAALSGRNHLLRKPLIEQGAVTTIPSMCLIIFAVCQCLRDARR
jgi:hypothetical protein